MSVDFEENNSKSNGESREKDKILEREKVKLIGKKGKDKDKTVPYLKLYSYATPLDKFLTFFGLVFSALCGVLQPVMMIVFGDVTGDVITYVSAISDTNLTDDEYRIFEDNLYRNIEWFAIYACTIGILLTIFTYASGVMLAYSSVRQISRIRYLFFEKTLNQDIGWYDHHQTGDFSSILTDNIAKIEDGIGEKVGIFVYMEACFVAGVILALSRGWKLALVCMPSLPLSTIIMAVISWISAKYSKQELESYGAAGAISEETLSNIRTVVAFDGHEKEIKRYNRHVVDAKNNNVKRCLFNGISQALLWFLAYACYALAFWYGVGLIIDDRALPENERVYTPGNMISVFFSTLIAGWYFNSAAPFFEVFGIAKGAAEQVFSVLNSEPIINKSKNIGKHPYFENNISFNNVNFHYPSRTDVKILKGLNLNIKYGEKVALVGNSGCGKSTVIQLIQRFYDPVSGNVTIDGENLKQFNLSMLRKMIGVVSQEPALFATTIAENIRYGKLNATQSEIEEAAKKSNAHKFIMSLPHGYQTIVGERGAQLSGGQKQRIAIARALIRNPKILLLDEATSALDTTSEAEVQAALDEISNDCTTIIVAHRLSTIRNADRILVFAEGKVEEEGSHQELMEKQGMYYNLVSSQGFTDISDKQDGNKFVRSMSLSNKSEEIDQLEQIEDMEEEKTKEQNFLLKTLAMNKPEWLALAIGCISALFNGASLPLYGLVFGDIVGVLSDSDEVFLIESTNRFCIYFLLLGVVTGIAMFFQTFVFGYAGEKLTMRIRQKMFKAMLFQEMAWFDRKENGVGALCAQLSGDAASVQGAGGYRIGILLNAVSTFILSCTFGLILEWRLSLILLAFCPVILLSIHFEQKTLQGDSKTSQKTLEKSAKIAVEAVGNIRTVAGLGCEQIFCESYFLELHPNEKSAKQKSHFRGIVMGFARSLMCFAYAAGMAYGAYLIISEKIDYGIVFKVNEVVISSSWSIGNALSFSPNLQKGINAAGRIFKLLERIPLIRNVAYPIDSDWTKPSVNYSRVYFSYPTRPAVSVLNGLDLSILEGKTVALVGASGCGKSTCIQLLERFYDPSYGEVAIGDDDVKIMDIRNLRSQLGIVSQEPNLFDKTIAENIAYGANDRKVSLNEVTEAAKSANIHNFIVGLPLGYETRLGSKGTQLSGGQKQRIAIARALVRNPKILLLDEATSALDNESEKVVQEALDNAKKDRTCITIAHRLTTIQDADVICVIKEGTVAEMGKHTELLQRKGLYYKFYKLQSGQH